MSLREIGYRENLTEGKRIRACRRMEMLKNAMGDISKFRVSVDHEMSDYSLSYFSRF